MICGARCCSPGLTSPSRASNGPPGSRARRVKCPSGTPRSGSCWTPCKRGDAIRIFRRCLARGKLWPSSRRRAARRCVATPRARSSGTLSGAFPIAEDVRTSTTRRRWRCPRGRRNVPLEGEAEAADGVDSVVEGGVAIVEADLSDTKEVISSRAVTNRSKATIKATRAAAAVTVEVMAAEAAFREVGRNRKKTTTRATAATVAAAGTVPVPAGAAAAAATRAVISTAIVRAGRVIVEVVTAVAEIITTSSSNTTGTIAMTVGIEAVIGITTTITIVAEVVVVVAGPTTTGEGVVKGRFHDPSRYVCVCVRCI
uniref:(northern house mosquito) hypothetical protein n=1 Tax=Culex pipiens TaxID=7175 RepID=A0A8D8IPU4_CULPI